jgi:hypothetical protein
MDGSRFRKISSMTGFTSQAISPPAAPTPQARSAPISYSSSLRLLLVLASEERSLAGRANRHVINEGESVRAADR